MVYVPPGILGGGSSCSSLEGAGVPPMLPSATFVMTLTRLGGYPWEYISLRDCV